VVCICQAVGDGSGWSLGKEHLSDGLSLLRNEILYRLTVCRDLLTLARLQYRLLANTDAFGGIMCLRGHLVRCESAAPGTDSLSASWADRAWSALLPADGT
jgi:hypothetical protein